ncbi:8725_t:CDS:2, partial [Ambispora gerdemannii]
VPKYAYFDEEVVRPPVPLPSSQPQPPLQNEYIMRGRPPIPPSSPGNYDYSNSNSRSLQRGGSVGGSGGDYYNQGHLPHHHNYHPIPTPLNTNQLSYANNIQQSPRDNPGYSTATYSNANPHLTQPYTRTNVQQAHLPPQQQYSAAPPPPSSPQHHSQSPVNGPVPSRPEVYPTSRLNNHSPSSSSSRPTAPAPAPAPIIVAPTYGDKESGGGRKHHHDYDDNNFADCGIALFAFSNTLPSKCNGLCDPNSNNGTLLGNGTSLVKIQAPSLLSSPGNDTVNTAISSVDNTTSDASQSCSNVCKQGVYNALHYSGITLLIIGALMLTCQKCEKRLSC